MVLSGRPGVAANATNATLSLASLDVGWVCIPAVANLPVRLLLMATYLGAAAQKETCSPAAVQPTEW
jgi:hypothetical protein